MNKKIMHRYCNDVRYRVSPLHQVMARGTNAEVLSFMDHAHYDVSAIDSAGQTPLYYAIFRGYRFGAKMLLERGAKVIIQDLEENSPLHFAVKCGFTNIVLDLLKSGASTEVKNNYGQTVLQYAIVWNYRKSSEKIVKLLLENGANVNERDKDGESSLHAAASRRDSESLCLLLLRSGAKIHGEDKHGNTPLHIASSKNCQEAITALLDSGADYEYKNKAGETSLHSAVKSTVVETVKILLDHGADVNAKNNLGMTPLHVAASGRGGEDMIKLILDKGADPNDQDSQGFTALHYAVDSSNYQCVYFLLEQGALLNIDNYYGENPVVFALQKHNKFIIDYILNWETPIINGSIRFFYLFCHRFELSHTGLERLFCHLYKLLGANLCGNYELCSDDVNFEKIQSKYLEEVNKMKLKKFGRVSLYEVFSKYKDPNYLSNEELERAINSAGLISDFPNYCSLLKVTFKKAQKRFELLNDAQVSLRSILSDTVVKKLVVPNEVLRKILSNLDEQNLYNVVLASEI